MLLVCSFVRSVDCSFGFLFVRVHLCCSCVGLKKGGVVVWLCGFYFLLRYNMNPSGVVLTY
jgi:hypothetical protein